MFDIPSLLSTVVDKIFPDANQREAAKLEIKRMESDGEFKLEELSVKDRDSARQREIQVKDKTPTILAALITVGFFGVLGYMLVHGLPDAGREPLLIMLGALGAAWTGVVSYYFGSSSGSRDKDITIQSLGKK